MLTSALYADIRSALISVTRTWRCCSCGHADGARCGAGHAGKRTAGRTDKINLIGNIKEAFYSPVTARQ